MELEVEVNIARAVGNLTFTSTETDAVFLLLAHLPGFMKDEIEVQIDEAKMEIIVSGGGQIESFECVSVDRLVNIDRVVEIESFCKAFSIPDGIIIDRIDATFDEDEEILVILIPKFGREEVSPAVVEQTEEEEEVSCDGDKGNFIEELPIPLESIEPHDRDENLESTEESNSDEDAERELEGEEEMPSEEIPDQTPNLSDSSENVELERLDPLKESDTTNQEQEMLALDSTDQDPGTDTHQEREFPAPATPDQDSQHERESAVQERKLPSMEKQDQAPKIEYDDQETLEREEEPDQNFKEEDEIPKVEMTEPIRLLEENTDFDFIQEQEEQESETTQNPISEEPKSPPPETPVSIKLPEIDTNFGLIEEQEPETTQNPSSEESDQTFKQEDENPTVENEDPPPKTPEPVKLPEIDTNFGLIEEQEEQEPETTENPKSEESNPNSTEEYENANIETEDTPPKTPEPVKLPEIDTNFGLIEEQEEQEPETTENPKSEESNPNSTEEYENANIETEDTPPKTPEPVKLPEINTNFGLIEEQEEQEPETTENPKSEESNPNSTEEYENANIETEDTPPKTPASIKLPENDMDFDLVEEQEMQETGTTQNPKSEESDQNFKQEDDTSSVQDLPPKTSEPIKLPEIDTKLNPIQEQEEQEPEALKNTGLKEPGQNFNQEDEDSDQGSEDMEKTMMIRERERRRVSKRSSGFPLNATSLLAGSAFLFSLVVLVFHFLRERKRSRN